MVGKSEYETGVCLFQGMLQLVNVYAADLHTGRAFVAHASRGSTPPKSAKLCLFLCYMCCRKARLIKDRYPAPLVQRNHRHTWLFYQIGFSASVFTEIKLLHN